MTTPGYAYFVMRDGQEKPVETWPHVMQGAISATSRAARHSLLTGVPHTVLRPDGRLLARFKDGRRADL